jgi:2-dehydro-3-deoxyphosphogluconate aldolase/(4S)-4-hydroxy-2-oxoglutarate aldolase
MKMIFEKRVVPVAVIDRKEDAVPVASALLEGGLPIIEVTFRTEAAEDAIRAIARELPDVLVGAGTVLSSEQLRAAAGAGARFCVAPGLNETIVKQAHELNVPMMPGVMTPSEIEKGLSLGCSLLKFFPAEAAGGIRTLKAIAGPYASTGVKFIPTGGINADNVNSYLQLPLVAAVGASWMVDKGLVADKNWTEITRRTREICALVTQGS